MAEIRFLTNEANKVEGLAYAGFETFRGSPYKSCARETGQNSRDAAEGKQVVKVSFDLLELARAQVPFADQLQHSIECCLNSSQLKGPSGKTRLFLRRAKKLAAGDAIKVLRIADFNTTGLTGPVDDATSVFAALVKGDGVTNKSDTTSAGSFGIGKNAAYAVSDLQTVIYSTRYLEQPSGNTRFAAQGRLRLISHVDNGKSLSAEGYWGNPGFAAIEKESDVPDWMVREDIGTSIFSVGFREEENWTDRMSLALVTNFFLAIDRGEIEFSLNDGLVQINQSALDSILSCANVIQAAEASDQKAELDRANVLMRCMRSDAAEHHSVSVAGLGEFTLHLLVEDDLPREVHVLRNGIYICDNFSKFGHPMRRFPGTREFIAVLEPARNEAGRKASELLKQLENPQHDAFEPERIMDPRDLKAAKSQISQLIDAVRAIIKSSAKIDESDRTQLDELSHLFAAGGAAGAPKDSAEAERDPDRFRYGKAQRHKRPQPKGMGENGSATRRHGPSNGDDHREGPPSGTPASPRSAGSRPAVPLKDVRSVLPDEANPRMRSLFFTPEVGGHVQIGVSAAGLGNDVALPLCSTSKGKVIDGKLHANVTAGKRNHFIVMFADQFDGPIELAAKAVSSPSISEGN